MLYYKYKLKNLHKINICGVVGVEKIKFSEIIPFARYVRIQKNYFYCFREVYPLDNRLFYCLGGKGMIEIEGESYRVSKDTVIMWRSGMRYKYMPDENDPYYFCGINFDLSMNNMSKTAPINPVAKEDYCPEMLVENVKIDDIAILNKVIIREDSSELKPLFEKIESEFRLKKLLYEKKASAILTEILSELTRGAISESTSSAGKNIDEILLYIESHCTENLTNLSIGKHFNYHPNHINTLVVRHTGVSLHGYLLRCRIQRAADLLNETGMSVTEAALKCGFSNVAYFSRYFKKIVGISPKELKNRK